MSKHAERGTLHWMHWTRGIVCQIKSIPTWTGRQQWQQPIQSQITANISLFSSVPTASSTTRPATSSHSQANQLFECLKLRVCINIAENILIKCDALIMYLWVNECSTTINIAVMVIWWCECDAVLLIKSSVKYLIANFIFFRWNFTFSQIIYS